MEKIEIRPIDKKLFTVSIEGLTPLITHRMSEKARKQMRDKKSGEKARVRDKCDPKAECEAAHYRLSDGTLGVPVTAIKCAMATAADQKLGVPKTVLRKAVFIQADEWMDDGTPLVRLKTKGWKMREDVIRVRSGAADLRYRPAHAAWSVPLTIEYDAEMLTPETILNLLERAGFGVGICEWRPEKDGEFGRFRVARGKTNGRRATQARSKKTAGRKATTKKRTDRT